MRYSVLLGRRPDFLFVVITILLQTLVVRLDCGWHVPTPHITGFQPAVANVQGGPWALPDRDSSLVSNLTEIQISWHPLGVFYPLKVRDIHLETPRGG